MAMILKRVHKIMRAAYAEFQQYRLFYSLMVLVCPLLYMALLWLDNAGNAP